MTRLLAITALALALAPGLGAQQTWTGVISDSLCVRMHETGGEGGLPETPRECTIACVRGGSKYVLVTEDKVFVIEKQDDPALETHAGATVTVTGTLMDGDVLRVEKIDAGHR